MLTEESTQNRKQKTEASVTPQRAGGREGTVLPWVLSVYAYLLLSITTPLTVSHLINIKSSK